MNIRHTFVALIALFSVITPMMAQELDPTVVVNKAYEGKLVQVHKPNIDEQDVRNKIAELEQANRYPGWKVGDFDNPITDGNFE